MNLFPRDEKEVAAFAKSVDNSFKPDLYRGIVALRQHFVGLGDTVPNAHAKVNELLESVAIEAWLYSIGAKDKLPVEIQNSTLPFMTQSAKDSFTTKL